MTFLSENILADSIAAVGLMIAFYYGMTGFACVWFYRRHLTDSPRNLLMRGILPFLGGSLLCGVFVLGIGALLLGAVLMLIYRATAPAFFAGDTLPRRGAHDLVLAGVAHEGESVRLPDSGLPEIVIRPDLSNLPEGATATDPVTGEKFHRED